MLQSAFQAKLGIIAGRKEIMIICFVTMLSWPCEVAFFTILAMRRNLNMFVLNGSSVKKKESTLLWAVIISAG